MSKLIGVGHSFNSDEEAREKLKQETSNTESIVKENKKLKEEIKVLKANVEKLKATTENENGKQENK